nr:type I polyketide synthase [Streptomyces sp. SID13031]
MVGIAVTYPEALTADQLWDMVLHQRTAFRAIPDIRLPRSEYFDRGTGAPDLTYVESAALIEGWAFDPAAFRVPQGLYEAADMSHWLALDTASRLLDGLGTASAPWFRPERTGVVLGNSLTGETSRANGLRLRWPFIERTMRSSAQALGRPVDEELLAATAAQFRSYFPAPGDESLAGAMANTIAGRICNHFDLHGTGYTVDAACSSSLLAVMNARDALLRGDLDLAISGGVDMSIDPFELVGFARLGALSRGEMRVYDADPTGFLPGEGCGLVALMRTADALRHDLPVYAVIAGAGMSSDGAGGLTRPAQHGHVMAATRAYTEAGLSPETVGMFEGHGTGTGVGDPIELATFRELRKSATRPVAVGSIKANIGHTKAAAGVAGLIKAALAVHHRTLPPATGFRHPHALIADSPALELLKEPVAWTQDRLVAGVSAMGFGGINTHVVLTDHQQRTRRRTAIPLSARTGPDEIVALAATTSAGLRQAMRELADDLEVLSDAETRDLAVTLARTTDFRLPYRFTCTFRNRREAIAALAEGTTLLDRAEEQHSGADPKLLAGRQCFVGRGTPARVGLLFPGQAAPMIQPGTVLEQLVDGGDLLTAARAGAALAAGRPAGSEDTRFAQPSIVAASLLGLAWLDTLGIEAHRAVGHSLGEITALIWSGALEPAAGLSLAEARGRIMSEFGIAGTSMLSVAADEETTAELITALTGEPAWSTIPATGEPASKGPELVVAGTNSTSQTTVAGPVPLLAELAQLARRRGVGTRRLPVSHGFHSAAMTPAVAPFREELARTELTSATHGVISTITGGPVQLDPEELRTQLVRQLVAPVRFREAVQQLAENCQLVVECGPGRMLGQLAVADIGTPVVSMDVGGDPTGLARVTAALAAGGQLAHLESWHRFRSTRPITRGRAPVLLSNPCGLLPGTEPIPLVVPPAEVVPTVQVVPIAVAQVVPASLPDDLQSQPAEPATLPVSAELDDTPDDAVVLEVLTELTGLPADGLAPELSLSKDLHLNSLQVGQLLARAAGRLGRAMPMTPLALADATIAELSATLSGLPQAGAGDGDRLAGALGWTEPFEHRWQPVPSGTDGRQLRWHTVGAPEIELGGGDELGLLVVLDSDQRRQNELIVETLRRVVADGPYEEVVIAHHGDGAGLGRSLVVELDQPPRIVCVETDRPVTEWLAEVPSYGTFADLRLDRDGWSARTTHHLRTPDPLPVLPLLPGDVCLVTGGVTGITAECAAELAERTGARLLFVGRRPGDDEQVARALAGLTATGLDACYLSCDLTDPDALPGLWAAAAELGPVRGLVHGAGLNAPQPLSAVTTESLAGAASVKHVAFEALLSSCPDLGELRLVATFGSIIGRAGLAGQTDYCLANDRLRASTERYAEKAGDTVVRHLEWSVWSAVGMGVDLGALDSLARSGVAAIGPEDGRRLFIAALSGDGPVTQLLTGRLPAGPTVVMPAAETPPLRYAETIRSRTPGVEVVAESELSWDTDRAVADHRIDELAVLPTVASLEAVAQAAGIVAPDSDWRRFTDLRLHRPITVDDQTHRTLRVAVRASRSADDTVDAVIRADDDGFGTDCVTMTVHAGVSPHSSGDPEPPSESPAGVPLRHLYGPLYFHDGAFQCVTALHRVGAGQLEAELVGRGEKWFSRFLPGRLMLGDPGLLDASIHALQACYPGRRLLPVSAAAFAVHRPPGRGPLQVTAKERSDSDLPETDLCFDIVATGPDGPALEWTGLVLRSTGLLQGQHADRRLAGAHLARRIRELGWSSELDAVVTSADVPASDVLAGWTGGDWGHSPAGRLQSADGFAATSSCDGLRLTIWAPDRRVGVDWLEVAQVDPPALSPGDLDLAGRLSGELEEQVARFAVWAAREAMVKAGHPVDAELTAQLVQPTELVLSTPDTRVLVSLLHPQGGLLVAAAAVDIIAAVRR